MTPQACVTTTQACEVMDQPCVVTTQTCVVMDQACAATRSACAAMDHADAAEIKLVPQQTSPGCHVAFECNPTALEG